MAGWHTFQFFQVREQPMPHTYAVCEAAELIRFSADAEKRSGDRPSMAEVGVDGVPTVTGVEWLSARGWGTPLLEARLWMELASVFW